MMVGMHDDNPLYPRTPSSSEGSPSPDIKLSDVSGLLLIACSFALAGGYMDAYSYLAHGHVFANAQTGNFVFFGVYASEGQWTQAARHLPPIAAFALGVAAAKLLGVRTHKQSFRATLICQTIELVILTILAILGDHLPDSSVVPIISFIAALQNTSFGAVGPWSFNSAMITGNLRDATSGLVLWIRGSEAEKNRSKAIALSLICLSFLLGAFCGGVCARWDKKHGLAPCIAIVAIGSLLTLRERKRYLHSLPAFPTA
jgi:uncharacterized membrane protein YoaK (UPF0700 family)